MLKQAASTGRDRINPFMGGGNYTSHLLLTPTETKGSGILTIEVCRHLVQTMSNKTKISWRILVVPKLNSILSRIFARAYRFSDYGLWRFLLNWSFRR